MAVVRVIDIDWSESDYIAYVDIDFYETCTVTVKYWIQKKYPGYGKRCDAPIGDVYYSGSFSLSGYAGQTKRYYWKIKTTSIPTGYYYLVVKVYYGGVCQDGDWRTIHYVKPSPPPQASGYINGIEYDPTTKKIRVTVRFTYGGTLYLGASIAEGYGGSGCGLYATGKYWDLPLRTVTGSTGQRITVEWSVPELPEEKTYYIIAKIWRKPTPAECIDGKVKSFTYTKPKPTAYINGIEYDPKKNKVKVTVRFTQGGTLYVGCTVAEGYGGSGCDLYVTGKYWDLPLKTIIGSTGETKTVEWDLPALPKSGTYYIIAKLWRSPEPADCISGKVISITYEVPAPPPAPPVEVPRWIAIPILGGLAGAIYYFAKKRL